MHNIAKIIEGPSIRLTVMTCPTHGSQPTPQIKRGDTGAWLEPVCPICEILKRWPDSKVAVQGN